MCLRRAIWFSGDFDQAQNLHDPWYLTDNGTPYQGTARTNLSGTVGSGNSFSASNSSTSTRYLRTEVGPMLMEEFIVEYYFYQGGRATASASVCFFPDTGNSRRSFINMLLPTGSIDLSRDGFGLGISGGTILESSFGWVYFESHWSYIAGHIKINSSTGFGKLWLNNISDGNIIVNYSGNTGGGPIANVAWVSQSTTIFDHFLLRPRCIRVRDSGSPTGTPTYDGTITGTTESATVYAWETNSADSYSGTGDPLLASNEFRLYLKDVSFGPEDSGATGFANGETVSITGVTAGGTLTVYAPHSKFEKGLEPGGMIIGNTLFLERATINATGNYNSLGTATLEGGATDVPDALIDSTDVKYISHTTDGERLTVTLNAVPNQSSIGSVYGVFAVITGLNDASSPNGVIPTIRDNSTDLDGEPVAFSTTNSAIQQSFDTTAAGGAWTIGTGAGGVESLEVGYESDTA